MHEYEKASYDRDGNHGNDGSGGTKLAYKISVTFSKTLRKNTKNKKNTKTQDTNHISFHMLFLSQHHKTKPQTYGKKHIVHIIGAAQKMVTICDLHIHLQTHSFIKIRIVRTARQSTKMALNHKTPAEDLSLIAFARSKYNLPRLGAPGLLRSQEKLKCETK